MFCVSVVFVSVPFCRTVFRRLDNRTRRRLENEPVCVKLYKNISNDSGNATPVRGIAFCTALKSLSVSAQSITFVPKSSPDIFSTVKTKKNFCKVIILIAIARLKS
jgi:hypothetical protein